MSCADATLANARDAKVAERTEYMMEVEVAGGGGSVKECVGPRAGAGRWEKKGKTWRTQDTDLRGRRQIWAIRVILFG